MFIEFIGFITVAYFISTVIYQIHQQRKWHADIKIKYGTNCWAVITGATDGIGKGFCQELSKQGVNICMVIRNKVKGEQLITELKDVNKSNQKKSEYLIVEADFVNASQHDFYQKIFDQIKDLDIGLLINNVGALCVGPFTNTSSQEMRQMMIINCYPVVLLTKALLPLMEKRESRSGVINLSSVAGTIASPYYALYSATKAYSDFFTQSLSQEYEKVDFLSLAPFYVLSGMVKKSDFMTISPKQCALAGLTQIGYTKFSYGHWKHTVMGTFNKFSEFSLLQPIRKRFVKVFSETKH